MKDLIRIEVMKVFDQLDSVDNVVENIMRIARDKKKIEREKLNGSIKIGDTVIIKNTGYHYTSYYAKFKEFGFKNFDKPISDYMSQYVVDKTEFVVFAKGRHSSGSKKILVGIQNDEGKQYLFSIKGLAVVRKAQP